MPTSKRFIKKRSKFARKFKPRVTMAVKKYVSRAINKKFEMKYTYLESGVQNVLETGYTTKFVGWPKQGITAYDGINTLEFTDGTRIGNQIDIKSIHVNFQLYLDGDTTNYVRHIIFQWNQPGGSPDPTIGDILLGTPGANTFMSPLNPYTKSQYKILYDRRYNLMLGQSSQIIKKLIIPGNKLHPSKIQYINDNEGGIGAILEKGNLWMFTISDSSSTVTCPEINFSTTLYYTDA